MNTDENKLKSADLTGEIIACAMEVLNTLGHGLLEKPYENALAVEFKYGNGWCCEWNAYFVSPIRVYLCLSVGKICERNKHYETVI